MSKTLSQLLFELSKDHPKLVYSYQWALREVYTRAGNSYIDLHPVLDAKTFKSAEAYKAYARSWIDDRRDWQEKRVREFFEKVKTSCNGSY